MSGKSIEEGQQSMDSEETVNNLSKSLVAIAAKWADSNPAIKQGLHRLAEEAVAISPFLRVLASDALLSEAKRRYQEEGVPITFDEAVDIATLFMMWRLPYTGDDRSPDADLSYIRDYEILASGAIHKHRLSGLIEKSASSPLAYRALQAVVSGLRQTDDPFPEELHEWSLDVAEGKRTLPNVGPGRSPYTNQIRDELIVRTVQALVGCGLTATRNQEPKKPGESACDAVSKALKAHNIELLYDSVAKVWAKGKANLQAVSTMEGRLPRSASKTSSIPVE